MDISNTNTHQSLVKQKGERRNRLRVFKRGIFAVFLLQSCSPTSRFYDIGGNPPLTRTQDPTSYPGYRPVQMPLPEGEIGVVPRSPSLWQPGARKFLKDQRASRVGDIVTVCIVLNDNASLSNSTNYTRQSKEKFGIPNLFGFEQTLSKALPSAFSPKSALNLSNTPSFQGDADITRSERVDLKVAIPLVQSLPNGHFVLFGRQEVRINGEVRVIEVMGIARPEDIRSDNTIASDKIAELRVSYGGHGILSNTQRPSYGQEILDHVLPF